MILVGLLTEQHAEVVLLSVGVLPRSGVRGRQAAALAVNHLQLRISGSIVVGFQRPVAAALDELQLGSVGGLQGQLLDGLPLQVEAAVQEVGLLPLVVVGCGGTGVRVRVLGNSRVEVTLIVIPGCPGQNGHACEGGVRVVQRLHGHVVGLGVTQVDAGTRLQVRQNLVVNVHTTLHTLEVRAVVDTLRLVVRQRVVVLGASRATRHGNLVLLRLAATGEVVHPVRLLTAQQLVRTIVAGTSSRVVGILAGIDDGVTLILQQLLSVHDAEVVVVGQRRNTVLGTYRELALALLTALGGNQNHTVGGAATVHRGSGSVLQHRNRLDVVGVDGGNGVRGVHHFVVVTAHHGNTVHHVQRVVAGVDRAGTTDTDARE